MKALKATRKAGQADGGGLLLSKFDRPGGLGVAIFDEAHTLRTEGMQYQACLRLGQAATMSIAASATPFYTGVKVGRLYSAVRSTNLGRARICWSSAKSWDCPVVYRQRLTILLPSFYGCSVRRV
jgi:hypothetical protein